MYKYQDDEAENIRNKKEFKVLQRLAKKLNKIKSAMTQTQIQQAFDRVFYSDPENYNMEN